MSRLRTEVMRTDNPALPDETALYLIRDSVSRRRELIFGRLHDGAGGHCAIGSFWADNPNTTLRSKLIDEVATVNDSLGPNASPQERWKKVNSWLRWKVRIISAKRGE